MSIPPKNYICADFSLTQTDEAYLLDTLVVDQYNIADPKNLYVLTSTYLAEANCSQIQ